jgi:hypothetical protein
MARKTPPKLFLHPKGFLETTEPSPVKMPVGASCRYNQGTPIYPVQKDQIVQEARYYLYEDEVCAYTVDTWPAPAGTRMYRLALWSLEEKFSTTQPPWLCRPQDITHRPSINVSVSVDYPEPGQLSLF